MLFKGDTLDDLLNDVYSAILSEGDPIRPGRGNCIELQGAILKLTDPRARISLSEARGRFFSNLGELLWYLTGDNKLSFIRYYIPRYENESQDGLSIYGGYGPRLFAKNGNINQVNNVINLLKTKPDSRRAVIQLFDAVDLASEQIEIPCTCTLQFLLRKERLTLIAHMRSNDAYIGLPHDIFCFTMLQELIACDLGCQLGDYIHMVGSLHIYETNLGQVSEYLEEGFHGARSMEPMPHTSPWPAVKEVLLAEDLIRNGKELPVQDHLDPFWKDIITLLQIYKFRKTATKADIRLLTDTLHSKLLHKLLSTK